MYISSPDTYIPTPDEWKTYNIENIHCLNEIEGDTIISMSYSPDGKKIAYICERDPETVKNGGSIFAIGIMNSDATQKRILYENSSIDVTLNPPQFSPDGNKIAFLMFYKNSSSKKLESSIDILIRSGPSWDFSNITHKRIYTSIASESGRVYEFSWHPDGKNIILNKFYTLDIKNNGIWLVGLDGVELTHISKDGSASFPSYSPDGKNIIYISQGSIGNKEIWIMSSDGKNKHRIVDESWNPARARFTSDGRILFCSEKVSPHSYKIAGGNIWLMQKDGSKKTMLLPHRFKDKDIYWSTAIISPNMKRLLFLVREKNNTEGLYYIDDPTGEWKDSDGDGVYDGIDGAPNDPYMGYIGENPAMSWIMRNIVPLMIVASMVVAAVAAFVIKKRRQGAEKDAPPEQFEE